MTASGTSFYDGLEPNDAPPLVWRAVKTARRVRFENSVHPATGRLLRVFAGGVKPGGLIGETGTGAGVGLAWMASGARASTELVSVEIDPNRAASASEVFAEVPNVTVLHADAGRLYDRRPFDLLVLDGGWGSGKDGGQYVDPIEVLVEGGLLVIDDFTPTRSWPPQVDGGIDTARLHWIEHPELLSTEINVTPDLAVLVCRRRHVAR